MSARPLLDMTIGTVLDRAAPMWPDRDALICLEQGVGVRWRDLHKRTGDFAAGLEPGERIGIWSLSAAEWGYPAYGSSNLSTLRTGIMAGSPCPIEIMRKVIDQCTSQKSRSATA